MPRAANRPSQREPLLRATLDLVRAGGTVSLDSAARAGGVSKPGLMYHFPTKQALLEGLVDHLVDGYETDLQALLPQGMEPTPEARMQAYLEWATTYAHDAADLVMLTDPKLRIPMTARWAERFRPWTELPPDLSPRRRARLNAVRLLADGCWYSDATNILPLSDEDRQGVLAEASLLLKEEDS